MKCQNCGFENSGKFCTMCGTAINDSLPNTETTEFTDTNLLSQNPYHPQTQAPPIKESSQNTPANNPINTIDNQLPPSDAKAQTPNFSAPSLQSNGSSESVGSPYPQLTPTQKPENKRKILPVLMTVFVFAVVFAGIGICIYSSLTSNKSIIDSFSSKLVSYEDFSQDIPLTDSYDSLDEYYIDETAYLKYTDITLIDCDISKLNDTDISRLENYAEYKKVDFTFEVTNTTNDDLSFGLKQFTATNIYNNYQFELFALNNKDKENSDITIKPNKTEKVVISCAAAKDCDSIKLLYNDCTNTNFSLRTQDGSLSADNSHITIINISDRCYFYTFLYDYDDPFLG